MFHFLHYVSRMLRSSDIIFTAHDFCRLKNILFTIIIHRHRYTKWKFCSIKA